MAENTRHPWRTRLAVGVGTLFALLGLMVVPGGPTAGPLGADRAEASSCAVYMVVWDYAGVYDAYDRHITTARYGHKYAVEYFSGDRAYLASSPRGWYWMRADSLRYHSSCP